MNLAHQAMSKNKTSHEMEWFQFNLTDPDTGKEVDWDEEALGPKVNTIADNCLEYQDPFI